MFSASPSRLPLLLAALALSPVVAPLACAPAGDIALSDADADRIERFADARTRALAEALRSDNARERDLVAGLFETASVPVATLPDGPYRCRTIKLGGLLPLTAYGFFACTVSENGTIIDKTTGSQRFSGNLAPSGDALFYVGALHYHDESPRAYGADPEFDQVGCLYRVGGDTERYRLEMPFPLRESTHDVIELVPTR